MSVWKYLRWFKGLYVRVVSGDACYVQGEGDLLTATLLTVLF